MDRLKNGLLIWNILLSLLVGFLLFKYFSRHPIIGPKPESHLNHTSEFRMAYFEMDSVAANFELVKEVKAELAKKEDENNAEIDAQAKKFQQRYLYFQNLARNGNLSQQQSDSANYEIKTMDDNMKLRKQQLDQEYNDLMVRRQNDIKTKIEAFLKEYNKDHNFSYIVSYEQGLFYYKDTAYNITPDVIKGLNEMYKQIKK